MFRAIVLESHAAGPAVAERRRAMMRTFAELYQEINGAGARERRQGRRHAHREPRPGGGGRHPRARLHRAWRPGGTAELAELADAARRRSPCTTCCRAAEPGPCGEDARIGALLDHVRSYYEALNSGDPDRVAEHFADDAVHYYTRLGPHQGARQIGGPHQAGGGEAGRALGSSRTRSTTASGW